jgi:hypothetical protein
LGRQIWAKSDERKQTKAETKMVTSNDHTVEWNARPATRLRTHDDHAALPSVVQLDCVMTAERWHTIMHDDARLTAAECKAGWHFCLEYDLFLCKVGEMPGCDCASYTLEAIAAEKKEARVKRLLKPKLYTAMTH